MKTKYIEDLKEFQVMGKTVFIEKVKNYKEVGGLYATWHRSTFTIKVDADLVGKDLFDTICHELVHCVLSTSGIGFLLTDKEEEAVVRVIENNFFQPFLELSMMEVKPIKKEKK